MPTATSSSTIPEEPPSASTPKLHLHYVTVSGDSTPRRPNLINNLLDLSTKARLGGRRGIKRKALLYAGPDIDDVEQDIREAVKNVLADFSVKGGGYPPIPLRKKSAKKQLFLARELQF